MWSSATLVTNLVRQEFLGLSGPADCGIVPQPVLASLGPELAGALFAATVIVLQCCDETWDVSSFSSCSELEHKNVVVLDPD